MIYPFQEAKEREPVNWVDVMVVVLIAALGFLGWRNGVVSWAVAFAGGLVGIILAGRFYRSVAPLFAPVSHSQSVQRIAAFALIVLLALVAGWLLGRAVKSLLNLVMLGWVDKLAGLALGALAGALAAAALVTAMGSLPSTTAQQAVQDSALAASLTQMLGVVRALLPDEFDTVKAILRP